MRCFPLLCAVRSHQVIPTALVADNTGKPVIVLGDNMVPLRDTFALIPFAAACTSATPLIGWSCLFFLSGFR